MRITLRLDFYPGRLISPSVIMEPIAIVGFSFKLPQGIEDLSGLWETLEGGKNVMTPWPEDRINIDGFYSMDSSQINRLHSTGGHFLNGKLGEFDAPFFSMNSKEAAAMDPQQQILLETSYRALENAGISLGKVAGTSTGVFAGSMADDYSRTVSKDPDEAAVHAATGQAMAMLANRISWYFDLKGPSVQVNTACSSSMIAVDLACQSLRTGQSSLALVAGSSVMLGPEMSIYLTNMNVLSPDSLCYSFDHRANGYARGEGAIVFVLKCLTDAVTDGDMIRAVIRATGSNQDGHTPGIWQPSSESQEELIRTVYRSCGLGFESTHYVEAHGTGTQLGDSSEAKALGRVFKSSRSSGSPLYIGSIKANIGHLEGGSGLAGMLKSIVILEKGVIPPNALFEKLNPKINAKSLNIQVPTSCIPWPSCGLRRISVNSFGFGGSNGHVILDDAYHCLRELGLKGNCRTQVQLQLHPNGDGSLSTSPEAGSIYKVLVWSAKDEGTLKRMFQRHARYIESRKPNPNQLAYTLSEKRNRLTWRSFAVVKVGTPSLPPKVPFFRSSRDVGLAFVFTGQGAQYAGMGLELLVYSAFRSAFERADTAFRDLGASWSLYDAMQEQDKINDPQLSQPLGTALQLCLVELLKSFCVVPAAVVGHSSGEIAAAYTAGAISFQSACRIAYHRGRLAAQLATETSRPGAMMSVNLPEGHVQSYLDKHDIGNDHIHVACVNSPSNVTLSGDEKLIDKIKHYLDQENTFAWKLATRVAYHSPAMQEIASEYRSCLGALENQDGEAYDILMVSTITGEKVSRSQLSNSQYWVDNLISPVRFSDALQYLEIAAPRADGLKPLSIYLEIGPSGSLRKPVCDTVGSVIAGRNVEYISTLSKDNSPLMAVLNMGGQLFARGYPVCLTAANQQDKDSSQPFLADVPEYPFDHSQTYWRETRLSRDWRLRETAPKFLGSRTTDWNPLEPRWRLMLSVEDIPWISHHVVGDVPYFPGTGILIMALEAVKQKAQAHQEIIGFVVKEITFISPIVVRPESKTEVITQLRPLQQWYEKSNARFEVRIFACVDSYWNECSSAIIRVEYAQDIADKVNGEREVYAAAQASVQAFENAKRTCIKPVKTSDFYKWHAKQGLKYGQSFSLTEGIFWDGSELGIGHIDLASAEPFDDGIAHPGVLDCAFQVAFTAASHGMTKRLPTMILHKLEDVWISPTGWQYPNTRQIRVLSRSRLKAGVMGADCSFTILSDDGMPLCRIKKIEMLPAGTRGGITKNVGENKLFHSIVWKPQLSELNRSQLQNYCKDFKSFLQLTSHETPSQRLLEIGSGSRDTMDRILSILNEVEESIGGIAFSEYCYTEASEAPVKDVREEYTTNYQSDRLSFATFHKENDINSQGLEQGAYSIAFFSGEDVSCNTDTRDLASFMRSIRRALKPGGYLVIHGVPDTNTPRDSCNEQSPLIGEAATRKLDWGVLLDTAGFSSIFMAVPGLGNGNAIISDAVEEPATMEGPESLLIIDDQNEYQKNIASFLLTTTLFKKAELLSLAQLATKLAKNSLPRSLVFLAELGKSLLAQIPESLFTPVRKLIQSASNILWITSTDYSRQGHSPIPLSGASNGFLRAIRTEYSGKRIVSLSLEGDNEVCSAQEAAVYITQAFTSGFTAAKPEVEYVVKNGVFYTGRLISETTLDEKLVVNGNNESSNAGPKLVRTEELSSGPALKVEIESPGSLETLRLIQDDSFDGNLSPGEVEIQAKVWGLSFRDVFIALGRLEEDDFGLDCAGIVTRVGPQCDLFRPGDRVCMAAIGCMRMYPRADQGSIAKIPKNIGFAHACAAVSPGLTAWRALVDIARIQKDDKVLIHAASGGIGQFAVQIARHFGAEIFATVGYDYKKQLLVETYGIPEDHIFYSRNTSFVESISLLTNGYGVDIVLNSLVGEGLRASWECIAPYGRFVEIGKADIHSNSQLPIAQLGKNVTFAAVDIRHILLHRQDIASELMRKTMNLVTEGVFHAPTPLHSYNVSTLEEAFRYFQSGKNTGRVIIDLDPSSLVEKHLSTPRMTWTFDSNACYVIAGGLGGIGRSVLKWMVQKGAKYLIVPSRSGTKHRSVAAEVVKELAQQGVVVYTPQCDVSAAEDLSRLLTECNETLPRIKGCINAAMVLNDTMFDNMTYSQWERTVRSKVQTSWNLHVLLPNDLDIFILLSSISGIVGNPGQSNYAAGCAFQDAVAQYRTRNGQKALSLDLGVVRDVGVVAESEGLQKKLTSGLRESRPVSEGEVLAFLDLCCDPERPPSPSHIIMGLGAPANLPEAMQRPLFTAHVNSSSGQEGSTARSNVNYGARFRRAESAEERASIVLESLAKKLARALSIELEDIDSSQPLHVFGVDSLVAMEIKNWITKEFSAEVAVFELMGGRSVAAICELVTRMSPI
ncbi:putative polyketide synthase [Hypoxylon trugodes]|uniref:putative polyketide synthase n=1 Tax=Hypoxylon trugodes TaxID=326681 RepID=UPI002190377C|nr:putative polyketide synthase [Hypoxylon trugodes]KAI1382727.1 putative polyketide synthase [Hypoxylon trugodes]